MAYSLASLSYQGTRFERPSGAWSNILSVYADGTASRVNNLSFFTTGDAKRSDRYRSLIEAAAERVFPNLLGSPVPEALTRAMHERQSISLALGDVQIEYGYKVDKPYWTEPDQAVVSLKFHKPN